ncbi:hypothetical protein Btru_017595 [Bulinus truncatus]|nr:hypothetical protein Btru_017595 [Bulinus truncatus]
MTPRRFGNFQYHGNLFYLAFPELHWIDNYDSGITVYFSTEINDGAVISFTTPHFQPPSEGANVRIRVESMHTEEFYIGRTYLRKSNSSWIMYSFKFKSDGEFSMSARVMESRNHLDSFQAIPVDFWGLEYYIYTLGNASYFQIISHEMTNFVQVVISLPGNISVYDLTDIPKRIVAYADGEMNFVHWNVLYSGEVLLFSTYRIPPEERVQLTGTKVLAEDCIGVIIGSGFVKEESLECGDQSPQENADGESDLTLEMLLPKSSCGTHFIVFATKASQIPYTLAVQSTDYDTVVTAYLNTSDMSAESFVIGLEGEVLLMEPCQYSRIIKCTKPVQVFYIQITPCEVMVLGSVSFTSIVPTELYNNEYLWGTYVHHEVQNYVVIIFHYWVISSMLLNGIEIENLVDEEGPPWEKVSGSNSWVVMELPVAKKFNSLNGGSRNFGCYVYGMGMNVNYMQVAGYTMHDECGNSSQILSDMIDNDCDFDIDEETLNGRDDDNDTAIDEDLGSVDSAYPDYDESQKDTVAGVEENEDIIKTVRETVLWLLLVFMVIATLLGSIAGGLRSLRGKGRLFF